MTGSPHAPRTPAPAVRERSRTGTIVAVSGGSLLLRLPLAAVFGFAGWIKATGVNEFAFAVKGFKIFPDSMDHMVVVTTFVVPWVELVAAAMLALGWWTRSAALVLALLTAGFTGAILSVIARGLDVKCGCFGKFTLLCPPNTVTWCNVGQNAVLLTGLVILVWLGSGVVSADRAWAALTRPRG